MLLFWGTTASARGDFGKDGGTRNVATRKWSRLTVSMLAKKALE